MRMKRSEIPEEYKWDLSRMYKDLEDFMRDFDEVKNLLPKVEEYKEIFLNSADVFIEFMELIEKINRKAEKRN